ncbi:hypothetical protein FRB94_014060 [Tulasnella sp. JGI-2019a]|nr:hypothetical protein FRB94_014060 [Tulasnella sp. JGI-2019a]
MSVDALQTVKVSLQALSIAVHAMPIPQTFKDAVLQIIRIVESAKGNMENAKVLALYIATMTDRTLGPLDFSHVTSATEKRIYEFQEALKPITEEIRRLASQRSLRKWIIYYDRDASKLTTLRQKIADIVIAIQLETAIATGHEVDVVRQKQDLVHEDQQAIIQMQELIYKEQHLLAQKQGLTHQEQQRKQQETEIDRLIALLGNGDSGSSKKPPCLDGTRVSLLKWITRWIEEPSDNNRRGLCLIGAAGRGKSSVGASVAQQERESKRLGDEFFFAVDQQDRNEMVIPVLARQLASWGDRRLRVEIASVVDEDRDIAQRTLEIQFKKLIREPLITLADDPNCPILVILLDGLDECNNKYASQLLDLIGKSFAKLPAAVRFIITSRPEPHLLRHYNSESLNARLCVHSLDSEDVREVEKDIEAFFRQELVQIAWGLVKSPSNWPGEGRLRILIRMSGGLWIWAVTVIRMLADQNFRDPEKQLDALLSSTPNSSGEHGHNTDLYAIFSKILQRACSPSSHIKLLTLFQDVLGALCMVKVPVNTCTLASLLCHGDSNLEALTYDIRTKVLGYLQAVLVVPDIDDPSPDAKPIRFIHKAFGDYLTDQSRCDARFLVDIPDQHRRMAIRCMRHMEDLQRPNICNLDPTMLNAEIKWHRRRSSNRGNRRKVESRSDDVLVDPGSSSTAEESDEIKDGNDIRISDIRYKSHGIDDLVRQHISLALKYACENWATHVSRASPDCDDVYALMEMFVKTRLLFWLEVLSLLGVMGNVFGMIEQVEHWIKVRPLLTRLRQLG